MDNRFGDFRQPPSDRRLGPEARRFRHAVETTAEPGWQRADFDDSGWPEVTYSFGPYFWKLGSVPKETDMRELESRLLSLDQVEEGDAFAVGDGRLKWTPYAFSTRWGIERDPVLIYQYMGPHGLKKEVPDEFIDLGEAEAGAVEYLWTTVHAPAPARRTLSMRALGVFLQCPPKRCPAPGCQAWVNGQAVDIDTGETQVDLKEGVNRLLFKFAHPPEGRLRAHAVLCETLPEERRFPLRWFRQSGACVYDCEPSRSPHVGWYRFKAPPGLRAMKLVVRGGLEVWVDGLKCRVHPGTARSDSEVEFSVAVKAPFASTSCVALRIEQRPGHYGGATLTEPVELDCGSGRTSLAEWGDIGLATYSGGAWYRRDVELSRERLAGQVFLDLGVVKITAEVRVNGQLAGVRVSPPWRVDITKLVHEGSNKVEILVTNTLANHYSVGIPSPYVYPDQMLSGLLGPVRIETWPHVVLQN
jgi:hypothetical protein